MPTRTEYERAFSESARSGQAASFFAPTGASDWVIAALARIAADQHEASGGRFDPEPVKLPHFASLNSSDGFFLGCNRGEGGGLVGLRREEFDEVLRRCAAIERALEYVNEMVKLDSAPRADTVVQFLLGGVKAECAPPSPQPREPLIEVERFDARDGLMFRAVYRTEGREVASSCVDRLVAIGSCADAAGLVREGGAA